MAIALEMAMRLFAAKARGTAACFASRHSLWANSTRELAARPLRYCRGTPALRLLTDDSYVDEPALEDNLAVIGR